MRKNREVLDKKHPTYTKKVKEFIFSKEIEDIRSKIKTALIQQDLDKVTKKRILYVIHKGGGGTPYTNEDIIMHLQKDFDCYILLSSAKIVTLQRYIHNKVEDIYSWTISSKWSAKDFHNPEFRNIYFNILNGLKIDIVHIQHLIKHTFDLPDVASSLGLPIIMTFHDFYLVCPSYTLLDDKNNYCAGKCTTGQDQCQVPMDELKDISQTKKIVNKWRNEVSKIFSEVSALVSPTEFVKQLYISIYPELLQKEFKVIEHGRDFKPIGNPSELYDIPSKDESIKILIPGNIYNHKGVDFIRELKKEDKDSRLKFHFMGRIPPEFKNYGFYHGVYERSDFYKIVKKIKPTFVGIFSICPETYCHTLSEAWSCGIPVLTTKIGAQEERLNMNGGGWFIDHKNPSKAYDEIIRIADSHEEYIKVADQVKKITFKSTEEMANEYLNLYLQML